MHTKIVGSTVETKIKIGIAGQLLYKHDASNDDKYQEVIWLGQGGELGQGIGIG